MENIHIWYKTWGGRHKSVANGIKPEIDEKCGKWFETCYSTKG